MRSPGELPPPAAPLKPGERLDRLGLGRRVIIQRDDAFRFGIDAVLLAAFARVPSEGEIVDLGAGNGAVPLLLADRTGARFTLVDIQPELLDMARRSAELNGLQDRFRFVLSDVREAADVLGAARFDYATSNPPYVRRGDGTPSPNAIRHIARHETTATIDDFARAAARLLKPRGRTAWVYRPERLADLFSALQRARLHPVRLRWVHPRPEARAVLVLVEAVKGPAAPLAVEPPLFVAEGDGYSEAMMAIYRMSGGADG
ncbi:MAG: tRNA1(Val) (adenine(37)-N6)-methyltransferase [Hydrogenibacillus schlegelii]|nr:tRNA1(Val) (adenine(37)-N6)-methyltransferase [Hydrogenibacillus schlegelii]